MKTNCTTAGWLVVLAVSISSAYAQDTAFTYQGRLNDGGSPANGIYDLQFTVCDALTNGNVVGGPLTNSTTGVSNGLFTVTLDFGSGVFTGPSRWLDILVRTNGSDAFIELSPRQLLTPVPYALYAPSAGNAASVSGSVSASQISGTLAQAQLPGAVLTNDEKGVILTGSLTGSLIGNATTATSLVPGAFVTNASFWETTNLDTTAKPYIPNFEHALSGVFTTNGASGFVPVTTFGQDYDAPNLDGVVSTWSHVSDGMAMQNAGRFIGQSWDWWVASGGVSSRAMVLKGMAAKTVAGGGAFILETLAAAGSPGTHGAFNNEIYCSTNGMTAIGDLTDASDANQNRLKPPFWLTVYGDGSAWSGGSSVVPSFGIMNKPLVATPVPNAEENDGIYRYYTGTNGARQTYLMGSTPNNGSGLTSLNPANITAPPWATNTPAGIAAAGGNTNNASQLSSGSVPLSLLNRAVVTNGSPYLNYLPLVYNSFLFGSGNSTMSGSANTAVGVFALTNNTTGSANVAVGDAALQVNTTGDANVALSAGALQYNTRGSENTAIGLGAIDSNTTGNNNTAIGDNPLCSNTNGNNNTAIGEDVMTANTSGSDNTAVGMDSLYSSTGNNNIALGYQAGYNITAGSYNIDIGNLGLATDANIIRIGSCQTQTFIAGVITGDGSGLTNLNIRQLAGVVLTNNESGVTLSGTFSGDAAGLANLNPTNLSAGTATINISGNAVTATIAASVTGSIADAQLSANVALLNGTNAFTGMNYFAGVTTVTNASNIFNGTFTGSGTGLTNLSANAITGGLTVNLAVLVPGGGTNTLCFTNGVLTAIQ